MLVIVLIILNFPVLIKIKNMFYPNQEDFKEAIKFLFTPDLYSLFKGKYMKDRFAEVQLGLIVLIYGIVIAVEYELITLIFS